MIRYFKIGNYVHIYNRGNRKMPIIYDEGDKWRFLKILRYFNDEYSPSNLFRQINFFVKSGDSRFVWPKDWPDHKPLVKILSYCLKDNHYHLLLKEIQEGGISRFMQKFGVGFTNFSNIKHGEVGRIFQGPYKDSILLGDIRNIQYLDCYVQVFNPFEDYPGGLEKATKEFNKAFEFALDNPFCSLGESFGRRNLGIIDRDIFKDDLSSDLNVYKKVAYDALFIRNAREILGKSTLE